MSRVGAQGFFGPCEWLTSSELRMYQLSRLRQFITYLYQTNGFYRDVLDRAGVSSGDDINSLDQFRSRIPVTRKEDLLNENEFEDPRLGVARRDIRQITMTGGTSGRGQEFHALSARDTELIAACVAWIFHNSGLRPGDMCVNTLPVGLSAAGQWLYRALTMMRAVPLQVGMYDTETKVRDTVRLGARAVIGTPSYLITMANLAEILGIDLVHSTVDAVIVGGEPFDEQRAAMIERQWGAQLYSWYGATQRVIAASCERGVIQDGRLGLLHVPAQLTYLEVVDPSTGRHVKDREEGEVIGTFFGSESSPLLRYAMGDRAVYRSAQACSCGRGYDGIEAGAIHRYDDMLKIKGVNVWPTAFDAAILPNQHVVEYQGRVKYMEGGREVVEIEVEPAVSFDADQADDLAQLLENQVLHSAGVRASVKIASTPLPKFDDDQHKAQRWTDDRFRT